MKQVGSFYKKVIVVVVGILMSIVIILGLFIVAFNISSGNALQRAEKFYEQLIEVELPANTKFICGGYQSGSTNRTGNACNYYAMLCVESSLSEKQLKEYYQKIAFKPAASLALSVLVPHDDSLQKPQIQVYTLEQMRLRALTEFEEEPLNLRILETASNDCCFIVLGDYGYFTYLPVEEKHRVVLS